MTDKPPLRPQPTGLSLSLGDIYYILFRHKWKIALIAGIGVITALLLPVFWPVIYQSEAKVFVRYVLETKSPGQVGIGEAKSTEERGENVINTELEILTSLDLANQVAETIGPQKILAKAGGGTDRNRAAAFIHGNLLAEASKHSNVIRIVFHHPDPELVQPVLSQLIDIYLSKH